MQKSGIGRRPAIDKVSTIEGLSGQPDRGTVQIDSRNRQKDRDTGLFSRFLDGNDDAFRALYDLYERPLYLYILRLLSSEQDSQDVFQEVWVRIYRLRNEKAVVTKFSGLLFTVARNLSMNALRSRKLTPDPLEDASAEFDAMLRTHEVEDSDLRDLFERALAQLPVAQREAFVLREYNGYAYQEIADITGDTMVTVKTRAFRARERLRKIIAAWMELKSGTDF
ncbi:MAG: RNA polymerase sigma factor [Bacteroidota bacterium]|nr:RNA polymerase sigma factor [Bacteroidota bacterium]MDP4234499.1 RNA polymerase sigma factor [Bacteroidota bacterium]MDP4243851.1 RNA polymerase sigma factor [Bacteroidota bacterium]MDP4289197.1 RNA polymerase sigma factor [Bacteroidota bacterium]